MTHLHRLGRLKRCTLHATDGEIGTLKEVYIDDSVWVVRYFVIRTGTWFHGGDVLVAPCSVQGVGAEDSRLDVGLTREQIRSGAPVGSEKPVAMHYAEEFFRHYQWERNWIASTLVGGKGQGADEQQKEGRLPEKPEHPHLRNSDEIIGYHIHALDGEIGHVGDLILDDRDWALRYLEINTRNWLPGKHVLVATDWIQEVSWFDNQVSVDLDRGSIATAPVYDPNAPITAEDEALLHQHYGRGLAEECESDRRPDGA